MICKQKKTTDLQTIAYGYTLHRMKPPRRLAYIDLDTNELLGVAPERPRRITREKRFFMLDQDTEAMRLLLAHRLPATVLQVFLHALTQVEQGNIVALPLRETAEACGIDQRQVSVALKRLRQIEALAAFRSDRRTMYMIDPAFGWHGKAQDFPKGIKTWAKLLEEQRKSANDPKFAHSKTA